MEKDVARLISQHINRPFHEVKEEIASEVQRTAMENRLKQRVADLKEQLYEADLMYIYDWFQTGCRPEGISAHSWSALSELACSFVDRGDIERKALLVFQ